VSRSKSTPEPESATGESRGFGCPARFSSGFAIGALLVAAAGTAGIVVLSAFTSWWVLFALFAVLPPLMMVGCLAMMSAMRGWIGIGGCSPGPCARWLGAGAGRATWAD
jgi:hypothetical protein